jgi:protein-tyrosine-phosphatase
MNGIASVVLLAVVAAVVLGREDRESPQTVVFVCEHGNAKSLIASEWFNRLARDRGLKARAVSRGLTPETPVPPAIAEKLRGDGFDVSAFEPRAFAPADLDGAARVVLISAEAPTWAARPGRPVDKWDGIPPASERYEASRDAMRSRMEALVDAMASRRSAP